MPDRRPNGAAPRPFLTALANFFSHFRYSFFFFFTAKKIFHSTKNSFFTFFFFFYHFFFRIIYHLVFCFIPLIPKIHDGTIYLVITITFLDFCAYL